MNAVNGVGRDWMKVWGEREVFWALLNPAVRGGIG